MANLFNYSNSRLAGKISSGRGTTLETEKELIHQSGKNLDESVRLTQPVSPEVITQSHDILATGGFKFIVESQKISQDPYLHLSQQKLAEGETKVDILRDKIVEGIKTVTKDMTPSQLNVVTDILQSNLTLNQSDVRISSSSGISQPSETSSDAKALIASTYKQNNVTENSANYNAVIKVFTGTLNLIKDVNYEFAYLVVAGVAKLTHKDHDTFVFAWGERLGLTDYFSKYINPSTLNALKPA